MPRKILSWVTPNAEGKTDDMILREMWGLYSGRAIRKALGNRRLQTIYEHARRAGLPRQGRGLMSVYQLAWEMTCDAQSVPVLLKSVGIKLRRMAPVTRWEDRKYAAQQRTKTRKATPKVDRGYRPHMGAELEAVQCCFRLRNETSTPLAWCHEHKLSHSAVYRLLGAMELMPKRASARGGYAFIPRVVLAEALEHVQWGAHRKALPPTGYCCALWRLAMEWCRDLCSPWFMWFVMRDILVGGSAREWVDDYCPTAVAGEASKALAAAGLRAREPRPQKAKTRA